MKIAPEVEALALLRRLVVAMEACTPERQMAAFVKAMPTLTKTVRKHVEEEMKHHKKARAKESIDGFRVKALRGRTFAERME